MKYNPEIHHRESIRLKGYDYSKEGLYFITICTQNRECLFGEIINGKMILNNAGKMIEEIWFQIPKFYEGFVLHEFVIMPNHMHGIIEIIKNVGADSYICPNCNPTKIDNNLYQQGEYRDLPLRLKQISISELIQRFKSLTTNKYIKMVKIGLVPPFDKRIWQRNYFKVNCEAREGALGYENIIRNEKSYLKILEYIKNNPLKWDEDKYR